MEKQVLGFGRPGCLRKNKEPQTIRHPGADFYVETPAGQLVASGGLTPSRCAPAISNTDENGQPPKCPVLEPCH